MKKARKGTRWKEKVDEVGTKVAGDLALLSHQSAAPDPTKPHSLRQGTRLIRSKVPGEVHRLSTGYFQHLGSEAGDVCTTCRAGCTKQSICTGVTKNVSLE